MVPCLAEWSITRFPRPLWNLATASFHLPSFHESFPPTTRYSPFLFSRIVHERSIEKRSISFAIEWSNRIFSPSTTMAMYKRRGRTRFEKSFCCGCLKRETWQENRRRWNALNRDCFALNRWSKVTRREVTSDYRETTSSSSPLPVRASFETSFVPNDFSFRSKFAYLSRDNESTSSLLFICSRSPRVFDRYDTRILFSSYVRPSSRKRSRQ